MFDEVSVEQRAHDLAVQAVLLNYRLKNEPITSKNASDFVCEYRELVKHFIGPVEEGKTDLR